MMGVIRNLLLEEQKRRTSGEGEVDIFTRPDQGYQMMDDIKKPAIQVIPGLAG